MWFSKYRDLGKIGNSRIFRDFRALLLGYHHGRLAPNLKIIIKKSSKSYILDEIPLIE